MDSERRAGFQWNVGGWFGSQLGCTVWILVSAIVVWPRDTAVGLIILGLFIVANGIGTAMWLGRSRIDAYRAIQALVVLSGAVSLAAVWVLDRSGQFEALSVRGSASADSMYLMLALLVPGLLLLFYAIERQSNGSTQGP